MGISGASLLRVAASIAVDITIVPHDVAVLKWRTVVCILQVEKLRLCIHYKMASKSKSVPREFWLTVSVRWRRQTLEKALSVASASR